MRKTAVLTATTVLVLGGASTAYAFAAGAAGGDDSAPHDRAVASWLTGMEMHRERVEVGTSVDQYAAAHLGKETQFASLEMGCEEPQDGRYPHYKDPKTPLPTETNPRKLFERLHAAMDLARTRHDDCRNDERERAERA